jgi:hypothetical protein
MDFPWNFLEVINIFHVYLETYYVLLCNKLFWRSTLLIALSIYLFVFNIILLLLYIYIKFNPVLFTLCLVYYYLIMSPLAQYLKSCKLK